MATFLQRSNAWIESTFLYASTVFDPDSINVDNSNSGGGAVDLTSKAHDNDNAVDEEDVPQTEDTIPSGLVSSQKQYNNNNNNANHGSANGGPQQRSINNNSPIPPPSRRGKFVQVLHSGGSLDYYTNHTNNINDRRSSNNANSSTSTREQSLPPHIVISDGEYCCIAFLSPETCVALLSVQPFSYNYCNPCGSLPSKRSIIGISQYTVSTILQCCHHSQSATTTTRQQQYDDDIMSPPTAAAAAQTFGGSRRLGRCAFRCPISP